MDGPAPGEVPHERSVQSLTQQPFGQTERISDDQGLRDVAFLDLNASPTVKHKLLSSTDLAKEDTTTTPSSSSSRAVGDSTKLPNERESDEGRHRRNKSQPASRRDPPNPVVASDGENSTMPSVDHTITQFQPQATDKTSTDGLPRIEPGDGEGPDVTYGQDVVLDMDGYHSSDPERPNAADRGGGHLLAIYWQQFPRADGQGLLLEPQIPTSIFRLRPIPLIFLLTPTIESYGALIEPSRNRPLILQNIFRRSWILPRQHLPWTTLGTGVAYPSRQEVLRKDAGHYLQWMFRLVNRRLVSRTWRRTHTYLSLMPKDARTRLSLRSMTTTCVPRMRHSSTIGSRSRSLSKIHQL
jgi:hypothetical protein